MFLKVDLFIKGMMKPRAKKSLIMPISQILAVVAFMPTGTRVKTSCEIIARKIKVDCFITKI